MRLCITRKWFEVSSSVPDVLLSFRDRTVARGRSRATGAPGGSGNRWCLSLIAVRDVCRPEDRSASAEWTGCWTDRSSCDRDSAVREEKLVVIAKSQLGGGGMDGVLGDGCSGSGLGMDGMSGCGVRISARAAMARRKGGVLCSRMSKVQYLVALNKVLYLRSLLLRREDGRTLLGEDTPVLRVIAVDKGEVETSEITSSSVTVQAVLPLEVQQVA